MAPRRGSRCVGLADVGHSSGRGEALRHVGAASAIANVEPGLRRGSGTDRGRPERAVVTGVETGIAVSDRVGDQGVVAPHLRTELTGRRTSRHLQRHWGPCSPGHRSPGLTLSYWVRAGRECRSHRKAEAPPKLVRITMKIGMGESTPSSATTATSSHACSPVSSSRTGSCATSPRSSPTRARTSRASTSTRSTRLAGRSGGVVGRLTV
jgi:hypothetical protein